MNHKITRGELKKIRTAIQAMQQQPDPAQRLFLSLVLPPAASQETIDYACLMCCRLEAVNVAASITSVLTSYHVPGIPGKKYELMQGQPLGLPCLRIYELSRKAGELSRIGWVRQWLPGLFPSGVRKAGFV